MKRIFSLFLFLILLFPLASSVNIELNSEYNLGETIIAKVSGNFLDNIQKEDVTFYRRHMATSIPNYDVLKIGGEFYIYAEIDLEKVVDNYTMRINDVAYMDGAVVSNEEIIGNFSILGGIADFSVSPGFISSEEDFYFEVQNLKGSPIEIDISSILIPKEGREVSLNSGEIKQIWFELGNDTQNSFVELMSLNQTYNLPVYTFVAGSIVNETITNQTEVNETGANETEENVTIISEENKTEIENNESEIIVEENKTEIGEKLKKDRETCAELDGTSCAEGEKCSGNTTYSRDALCCIGECEKEGIGQRGKAIGWVLIIVVGIFVLWFFKKKGKTKSKKGLLIKK
ncbi:hypothetical protein HOD29_03560 [archaeon]|jgi:hypothetical protein|nr:hypothetical protein [archaeon]